jgi:hypothetical protein
MSECRLETLLIQVPTTDNGRPVQVRGLGPGERVTFGRGSAVDVRLDDDRVSRLAGEIIAVEDFWLISNLSEKDAYVVNNPEGGGEYLTIPPRRIAAPVPFEFARVSLPGAEPAPSFLVFAPQHCYAGPGVADALDGAETTNPFMLDETAKYFLVLVALCEPRLRDSATAALPTAGEIVERLSGLPTCQGLTRTAVNYHIDYLSIHKLRIKDPQSDAGVRLEWKRAALVMISTRFGLVRQEHLLLLPPRLPGDRR